MPYAISAGHELTAQVAADIMDAGGNAFDAAVAANMAMFITEPIMASAGSSGFAMVCQSGKKPELLDFFSQTPLSRKPGENLEFFPVTVDFGGNSEVFHIGLGAATVPGTVAGLYELHRLYCTMPMTELAEPAIELCRNGVALDHFQAIDLNLLEKLLAHSDVARSMFFRGGQIKKEGDVIVMEEAADFLETLAREGEDFFYKGDIAQQIVRDNVEIGGFLKAEDFKQYRARRINPLQIRYNDSVIHVPPYPSIGGVGLALFWGLATRKSFTVPEAIKYVQGVLKNRNLVRPLFHDLFPGQVLDQNEGEVGRGGTSHFSIVDKDRNAIALTTSMGEGCAYFIPGTQMHLNNMLGETYLLSHGPHSWTPNTRLFSMMTPTIVTKDGTFKIACGSGGASRIPYAIGQVLHTVLKGDKAIEIATQLPRCHYQDGTFDLEPGHPGIDEDLSAPKTVWDRQSLFFGGVNSVHINESQEYHAYADKRRFGHATVKN